MSSPMKAERLAMVRDWLDNDEGMRIPSTEWGYALYQAIADLTDEVDRLTIANKALTLAHNAHAEVCDHDEPTVLGQLDNARENVLDLTAEVGRLRAVIESQIEAARREWLDEGNADALARAEHWRTLLHPTEETA